MLKGIWNLFVGPSVEQTYFYNISVLVLVAHTVHTRLANKRVSLVIAIYPPR